VGKKKKKNLFPTLQAKQDDITKTVQLQLLFKSLKKQKEKKVA